MGNRKQSAADSWERPDVYEARVKGQRRAHKGVVRHARFLKGRLETRIANSAGKTAEEWKAALLYAIAIEEIACRIDNIVPDRGA